ncbi:hypothetical protein CPLU01_05213 [Colletotrichum plurivorum]|uniref:Uncharacterized protein n=1 Tax=Colletotrichum plurivorum TaxID=2175906 RepID=A0A8H6KN08_9PEZI|nr:hypothetical protein CPLU01_05213 [Colletotrichum plurivorum]
MAKKLTLDWIERYNIPVSRIAHYQKLHSEKDRLKAMKPKKSRTAWLSALLCGLKPAAEIKESMQIKDYWYYVNSWETLKIGSPTDVPYQPTHELPMDYPGAWSDTSKWKWRLITVHRPLDWNRIVVVYLHLKDLNEALKTCVPWDEGTKVDVSGGKSQKFAYTRWTGSRKEGALRWEATIAVDLKHGDTGPLKDMLDSDPTSIVNADNVTNAWLQQRDSIKYKNVMLYQRFVTYGNDLMKQCMQLWDESMAGDFESFVEPLLPEPETTVQLPEWAW